MKNRALIKLRENLGKTQEEAAKEIGISRSYYAMIETGDRLGRYSTLKKIANYYGKSVDEIFGEYFFEGGAHGSRHEKKLSKGDDSDAKT